MIGLGFGVFAVCRGRCSGDVGGGVLAGGDEWGFGEFGLGALEDFDDGVLVEVEDGDFAIIFLEEEAVEPDAVAFVAGEPGAGVLAFLADDLAGDGGGVGIEAARDLLGDLDEGAGLVLEGFLFGVEACGGFGFEHGRDLRLGT